MKKIVKRTLVLGMSMCMAVSLVPAGALAAEPAVSGSEVSGASGAEEKAVGYRLAPGWEIMGEDPSRWHALGTDSVSIDVQHGDLYYSNGTVRNTAKNVFLHSVDESDFEISAKLEFQPDQDFQSAGLIIYRDENANFAATRRYHSYFENKSLCIQGVDADSFTEGHMADPSQEQAPIYLRVVKEGTHVTSYYRLNETDEWTEYDSREWASFEGAEAGDLKVGLYTGNSASNGSPAVFSDFTIQYGDGEPQKTAIFEETEIEEPDEKIEYVSDRDWYSASVGYGSPKKDCGVDGDAIVLGGKTYSKGIAAHADSRIVYDIEGLGVQRFQAVAGVNRSSGSCQFIVEADGTELVKTDVLHGTDETQTIDVEIPEGTKMLTLITNTGGDNGNYDHSIWADAKFVMDPNVSSDSLRKVKVNGPGYLPLDGEGQINVTGELVSGDEADLSNAEITYSSSDEEVLSVDGEGRMGGKKDGSAVVTVKVVMGEVEKTGELSVIVGQGEGEMWTIASPDESVQALFMLDENGEGEYFVLEDGKVVVDRSQLGLVTDAGDFTEGLSFKEQSDITPVTDEYDLYGAKVSHVEAEGREMTLSFTKGEAELDVVVRMYDDGMAFRYVVESADGTELSVSSEETTLTIPAGSTAYAMDYINHNEEIERVHKAEALSGDYCMPLLYNVEGTDTWCLISEADLGPEYCGTYLKGDGTGSLNFHLSKEQSGDVVTGLPFTSPWRFVVVGTAAEVNLNTMAETLSPDAEGDWSWVEPGVTSWTWLNRESTSDLETYKRYVDFSAEMGWEYLLLDEGWQPKGSSQGHPEYAYYGYYDWTEELVDYAAEKGIRLLVWANHNDLKDPAEREKRFAQWEEWGIAGVKPDFFNSSSQTYMQLYEDLINDTAEHHLLLNLHGLPKTAGERRTYPHLLTREAVFGHEQELFRPDDVSAFHNCMLPFTRNAVGPADYTPMFSYRNSNGEVRFSLAQMVAMPVVYESGIQCLADRPDEYIGSPAEFYFKDFPAAWDESVVLQADPGELVTIARRSGEDWYVGSMCNSQHDAVIDLSFLGDGEYYAVICKDGDTQEEIVGEMKVVTKEDTLTIPMLETGGAALKILKEKPSEPETITLDQTSLTLEQYDTAQLTAQITPEDTEMNQITWSSSDENVATVKNGQVVAVAPGHAVITASTGFAGGVKAECEVEVKEPEYILTEDWEITNSDPVYWDLNEDGSVTIQTQIGEIYSGGKFTVKNLFLTPIAQQGDFTVSVKLDFAPEADYQTAGLILFQDVDNNLCVSRRYHSSFGGDILAYHGLNNTKWTENNSSNAVAVTGEEQGPVSLQIAKSGDVLTLSYKWEGDTEWTQICQQTYTGLTGDLKAGLYVANAGNEDVQIPATFREFTVQYEGEDPVQIDFSKKNPAADTEELSTAVLEYALELAEKVSTEGVMDVVVEKFEAIKAEAQAILDAVKAGDTSVTQKQIDDSWKALIEIMQYMSFEKGDKSDLEAVISFAAEIEADLDSYVENGKQEFVDALAHARTVYDDEIAMQDEVEQAWRGLLKAMAELRLKADKDALEDLINEASAIDLSAYTEESAEVFRTALAEAQSVFADETLSEDDQAVVDAVAEELAAAMDGLVAKNDAENPGTGTDGDNGDASGKDNASNASGQNGTTENNSAQKAVKTGDTMAPIAGSAAAVMLAAAAGVIAYRRRRETR